MIPEKRSQTELISTLIGEKIDLSLDPNATEHLMGVLTELYADPELAVIREYSTNARDSHIEAGTERAIEVNTPNALSPNLSIQDWGVGLDLEEIREIYTKYGASTKRDTNDATGMLGLGCKSALAYTDQFTVIAIKNGRKIQASVVKNEDGVGELTVVIDKETDEHNGVKIIIPSDSDNESILEKAENLFKFWPENSVLLNGKAPERVSGIKISDKFIIVNDETMRRYGGYQPNYKEDRHRIVMGGVPYPFKLKKESIVNGRSLVVFAPIGSFHFTPSREDILDTPKSQKYLESVEEEFGKAYASYINTILEEEDTKYRALEKFIEARGVVTSSTSSKKEIEAFSYRGEKIPESISTDFTFITTNSRHWAKNSTIDRSKLYTEDLNKYFFVYNFSVTNFQAQHKNRLNDWKLKNKFPNKEFALFYEGQEIPSEVKEWVRPEYIVDWKDVLKATREPKTSGPRKQIVANFYDSIVDGIIREDSVSKETLDKAKEVFIFRKIPVNNVNYYSDRNKMIAIANILKDKFPDCICVILAKNRIAKFQRDFPRSVLARNLTNDMYDEWKSSLTLHEKLKIYGGISLSLGTNRLLFDIFGNGCKVSDPDLKTVVDNIHAINSINADKLIKLNEQSRSWQKLGYTQSIDNFYEEIGFTEELQKKYPLLMQLTPTNDEEYIDDIVLYVNSKYKKEKENV